MSPRAPAGDPDDGTSDIRRKACGFTSGAASRAGFAGRAIVAQKQGVDARITFWCPKCQPAQDTHRVLNFPYAPEIRPGASFYPICCLGTFALLPSLLRAQARFARNANFRGCGQCRLAGAGDLSGRRCDRAGLRVFRRRRPEPRRSENRGRGRFGAADPLQRPDSGDGRARRVPGDVLRPPAEPRRARRSRSLRRVPHSTPRTRKACFRGHSWTNSSPP